jgi:hypothetical protein
MILQSQSQEKAEFCTKRQDSTCADDNIYALQYQTLYEVDCFLGRESAYSIAHEVPSGRDNAPPSAFLIGNADYMFRCVKAARVFECSAIYNPAVSTIGLLACCAVFESVQLHLHRGADTCQMRALFVQRNSSQL